MIDTYGFVLFMMASESRSSVPPEIYEVDGRYLVYPGWQAQWRHSEQLGLGPAALVGKAMGLHHPAAGGWVPIVGVSSTSSVGRRSWNSRYKQIPTRWLLTFFWGKGSH